MLHGNTQLIGRYVINALLKDNTGLYNYDEINEGQKR